MLKTSNEESLTIVVPFYRGENYLRMLLTSIENQTSQNWLLFIVSELKSDALAAIAKEYSQDNRIHFVFNEKRLGINGNFKKCLDIVNTNFFCMPGYDDQLSPNYVEEVQKVLKKFPNVGIIQPKVTVIDESGKINLPLPDYIKRILKRNVSENSLLLPEKILSSLALGNWFYFPSIVWNTKIAKSRGFRNELDVALDLFLIIDLLQDGAKTYLMSEQIFFYRRHLLSDSMKQENREKRLKEERLAARYLSEVLSQQNKPIRSLLAKTSMFPNLNYLISALRGKSLK